MHEQQPEGKHQPEYELEPTSQPGPEVEATPEPDSEPQLKAEPEPLQIEVEHQDTPERSNLITALFGKRR